MLAKFSRYTVYINFNKTLSRDNPRFTVDHMQIQPTLLNLEMKAFRFFRYGLFSREEGMKIMLLYTGKLSTAVCRSLGC